MLGRIRFLLLLALLSRRFVFFVRVRLPRWLRLWGLHRGQVCSNRALEERARSGTA